MIFVYLAVGGVLGTFARYALGGWVQGWAGVGFPWGTFVVNVLGSFLLGFALRGADIAPISPELRTMITVGFCGAFTTFSTLTFETVALMQEAEWARAALYAFGSLGLGLLAIAAGLASATLLLRTTG